MDNPIILYRIQDKEGRGPFEPGFSNLWVEDRVDYANLKGLFIDFPCFWEKIKGRDNKYFGCACSTPEKLQRWFTQGEYEKLISFGYKAVKLVAHEIIAESDTQSFIQRNIPFSEKTISFNLY